MSAETFGVFANQAAGQASANAPPNANAANAGLDFEFMDEERAHNQPTSIVPRFHVLAARRASPQAFAVAAERSVEGSLAEHDADSSTDGPDRSSEPWGLPRRRDGETAFRGPALAPRLARRGPEIREKLLAFLAAPLGGARALADARSGVFSDTEGERDGRSGRPRGEALAADEVEGEVGGDEPGDELDADAPPERAAQLFPVLRLRDGHAAHIVKRETL